MEAPSQRLPPLGWRTCARDREGAGISLVAVYEEFSRPRCVVRLAATHEAAMLTH
jgi:hypothetical protein